MENQHFLKKCKEVGIDGLILPDLPAVIYESDYQQLMKENELNNIFLITPQTPDDRIVYLDSLSSGFVYMVADASVTGKQKDISNNQITYFQRIDKMGLNNPRLIGFGISDHQSFSAACAHANGAIIGSAFIRALEKSENIEETIFDFIGMIKNEKVETI